MGRAPSVLSIVRLTSARPSGGRPAVPAKMTSSILPPRRLFAPCSPITQLSASTTFDLPEPFGPTTHVMPGSSRSVVADANDLNPLSVRVFRCTWRAPRGAGGGGRSPAYGQHNPRPARSLAAAGRARPLGFAWLPGAEPDREGSVTARPAPSASPVVRDALLTWLLTRVSVVILAVAGFWLLARGTAGGQPGFVGLWDRWGVRGFVQIARFGDLGYPRDYPDTGTAAFFPGLPGALWVVQLITQDWVVAGLLVSLVAGGVAAVALARLAAADHGELVASRGVLYFAVSPFAVFLAAGYSEALFLAFALPAWLAARQRRWLLAGVLGGLAGTVRVTGLFLGAALIVQWLTSDRGGDGRRWRDLPPLLLPWAAVAGYVVYLRAVTGDWLAWQHVQAREFSRGLVLPWQALQTTWGAATDPN